jgi:SAM-dependent methyltransferase
MNMSELPFYHGSSTNDSNGGYPLSLPFEVYYDNDLRMFRLLETEQLNNILNQVYLDGSLVDGSISNESGNIYVKQLTGYLIDNLAFNKDASILEIGFGKGIILKELKSRGFKNLKGIEPGNHALLEGMEDIEIINGFFPNKLINTKLDLIYHFAVWEHIQNPIKFISNQLKHLSANGRIVFGVPNCEPYIMDGDVSIFLHEHFNYFTTQSIFSVVKKAGGKLIDIKIIEGMLVGSIIQSNTTGKEISNDLFLTLNEDEFWEKVKFSLDKLNKFFNQFINESDVAIYAPGRALNSLFLLGIKNVRLVDDNSEMRGRYLPTLQNQIESFEDICNNPPKSVLVFSKTFGEKIKLRCENETRLLTTKVISFHDI